MLIEISNCEYFRHFPDARHPFISRRFIELNGAKASSVFFLVRNREKHEIGLVAGLKDKSLLSHFSAPFGGFHYQNENTYISEIEEFVDDLKDFICSKDLQQFRITFPTSIYGNSFNSKAINTLIRKGFLTDVPDLTSYIDLRKFGVGFSQKNCRKYYNQALRNNLSFRIIDDPVLLTEAYNIIVENRRNFNRPIYMSLDDLKTTGEIWPVDFFGVFDSSGSIIASAVMYRFPDGIVYGVFWGDRQESRHLRPMDFLIFNLWTYYKEAGFSYIDLGISTETHGVPNEGLIRFKESHEASTELRYSLTWEKN